MRSVATFNDASGDSEWDTLGLLYVSGVSLGDIAFIIKFYSSFLLLRILDIFKESIFRKKHFSYGNNVWESKEYSATLTKADI